MGERTPVTTSEKFVRLDGAAGFRAGAKELLCLSLLTLALLLPFIGKPLHIDDPLYVWTAKHIVEHPVDFYGLRVNWFGSTEWIARFHENPPGVSYWLAFVGALLGWSEIALHAGMLVPAVLSVVGVWLLARRLGAPPMLAGLSLLAMPGFLVSSTTLMADVLATAFWTWAALLWVVGLQEGKIRWMAAGAVLTGLCVLTKYAGVGLIPLLLAYALAKSRRLKVENVLLLIPIAMALAYRARMISHYGVDPFAAAASFSLRARQAGATLKLAWVGLICLGGSCLPTLLLANWIFRRRILVASVAVVLLVVAALLWVENLASCPLRTPEGLRWSLVVELALFTLSGTLVFASTLRHLLRRPTAEALLLTLWICGIFIFGSLLNWTTNVRALLPATPAVAILLAAECSVTRVTALRIAPELLAMLGVGALAGLLVAQADQPFARSLRNAARQLTGVHQRTGRSLWYQGT